MLIHTTTRFERELKHMIKRGKDPNKFLEFSHCIQKNCKIPDQYKPHPLKGKWMGYWDCHLEPDWVVIFKRTKEAIYFARTGTHSDLKIK